MGEKSIQVKDFIRVFLGVCLLLVNVLAGLIGLSVLGVTSWLYIIQERFPFYFEERSEYIMIMLLVCGALLFVFSLQGILGGVLSLFIHPRSQSIARLVLILYSFALLLLYTAVIVAVSLQWDSFYFSRSYLAARYQDSLLLNYGQPGYAMVSGSINSVQSNSACCGYNNGDDYLDSNWLAEQLDSNLRPFSCCTSQTASCTTNNDDYNGELGCAIVVNHTFSLFYWILLAVVISAGFLVFLLISISTILTSCLIY